MAKVFILIFFILGIDTLVQYSLGVNILGWAVDDGNFRITSLFGEDEVLGSYVADSFHLYYPYFYFQKNSTNGNMKTIIYLLLLLYQGLYLCLVEKELHFFCL